MKPPAGERMLDRVRGLVTRKLANRGIAYEGFIQDPYEPWQFLVDRGDNPPLLVTTSKKRLEEGSQ